MSRIFVGRKKLTTEKNHICGTFWTDAAVSENLIFFFFFLFALRATAFCLDNVEYYEQMEAKTAIRLCGVQDDVNLHIYFT